MKSDTGRRFRRLPALLSLAAIAFYIATQLAFFNPGAAAPARSAGTILQYDSDGRVVGKVRRLFDSEPESGGDPARPEAPRARDSSFVPGEILAASEDPSFAGRARSLGFPMMDRARLAGLGMSLYRLRTPAGTAAPDGLALFRTAFPGVDADVNALIQPAAGTKGWDAVGAVGWPERRDTCGRGVSIGMIDTPVDAAHETFHRSVLTQQSFLPEDRKSAPPGHGTAVAALLVGDPGTAGYGGLVPGATLYAANIFEELDTGRVVGNLFALIKAFDWMVQQDVDVLNLSLETGENKVLDKAVDRALATGITITAAAGNGGADALPAFPAAHPQVLAATAIDPDLRAYRYANHGTYIDFAAPGVSLWTAVPGGGRFQSGTSFAVPFLTAAVAMQLATDRTADPERLRRELSQWVRDLGAPGKDDVFGWGLLSFRPNCS